MKTLLTTVAATFLATTVMAEEASSLSFGNFDFGGKVEGERNFTQGVTDVTLTPEVSYNGVAGWKLTASTDLTIYNEELLLDTALDNVVIDLEAAYALDSRTEFTVGTSWDIEAEERGDITVGVSFTF